MPGGDALSFFLGENRKNEVGEAGLPRENIGLIEGELEEPFRVAVLMLF